MKIAYLVLNNYFTGSSKKRGVEGNEGFMANGYAGLFYLIDELGGNIKPCNEVTASDYDIVLVSLTSSYDLLSFAKQVGLEKKWQKGDRRFKVIIGGAGCINIYPIIDLIDYAFFGRAEGLAKMIVNNEYEGDGFMDVTDGNIKPVKLRQPQKLLDLHIQFGKKSNKVKEKFTGCPNKCYYCHYSFSREMTGNPYTESYDGAAYQELDYFKIEKYNPNNPYIITAIDGCTEKIRDIYNRKLPDERIRDFLIKASEITKCKGLIIQVYTILGMEGENENSWQYMIDNMSKVDKYLKKHILIKIKMTPFRPSPLTPSQYSPSDIDYIQKHTYKSESNGWINYYKSDALNIVSIAKIEKPFKLISDLAVIRGTEKTQPIFNLITKSKKFHSLKSDEKTRLLKNRYDLTDLIREYDINEQLPTWFLEGYISQDKIKKMRTQMKNKMNNVANN